MCLKKTALDLQGVSEKVAVDLKLDRKLWPITSSKVSPLIQLTGPELLLLVNCI